MTFRLIQQAKAAIAAAAHKITCAFKGCDCGAVETFKVESAEFWRLFCLWETTSISSIEVPIILPSFGCPKCGTHTLTYFTETCEVMCGNRHVFKLPRPRVKYTVAMQDFFPFFAVAGLGRVAEELSVYCGTLIYAREQGLAVPDSETRAKEIAGIICKDKTAWRQRMEAKSAE